MLQQQGDSAASTTRVAPLESSVGQPVNPLPSLLPPSQGGVIPSQLKSDALQGTLVSRLQAE